ncbi:MAG: LysM domain-containing protein [Verrucomicrobiota bacterium]
MRWRGPFFLSLGVNLVLAAAWFLSTRPRFHNAGLADASNSATVKTNVIVRRQFFSWSELESPDYLTYIANLRSIGCPEQTIRDIIIAEVNALFARRLALEVVTPDQQWWRTEPDPVVAAAAASKARELDEERRALLTRLLGPGWEKGDLANLPRPSRPGVPLDGPVLGVLPPDVKQAVQEISSRAVDRLQDYLLAQNAAGKAPDPVELARLRQQTRDELARTLTPPQLEEYLLRYSQDASLLRSEFSQLKFFSASPDEFRNVFRATDPIDQQIQMLAGNNDPNSVAQRNALLQQRDNAVKLALGKDRYAEYTLLHDPAYRDAYAAAADAGDPGAVSTLYQIGQAGSQQEALIRANTNLTPQQMAVALQNLRLEQSKATALALGQPLPPDLNPDAASVQAPPESTVPVPQPTPPPFTEMHTYTLGVGESAATVAMSYGVPLNALRAANPNVNLSRLRPGDSIRIPISSPGAQP